MEKKERTGKPALMKELNIGLIKGALAKHRQATRVELSIMTGISQPTVNMLISQLLAEGVVVSAGIAESTGGRKAEVFALNRKLSGIVSIVAEGSGFSYVVTDLELQEEARGDVPRDTQITWTEQLCGLVENVLREYPFVKAIAIGVPGAVSEEGVVFSAPQIAEWEKVNVKHLLEERFLLPVVVINDINAIVQGYAHSMETGVKNLVYVHVGNGIGAGLLIDGKLYPGFKSFAGEIGYMQIEDRNAEERLGECSENMLKSPFLAKVLVNIICVLNPEKIAIGGERVSKEMFSDICKRCAAGLPEEVLPQFSMIEAGRTFYFYGLGSLGRDLLDKKIRIV